MNRWRVTWVGSCQPVYKRVVFGLTISDPFIKRVVFELTISDLFKISTRHEPDTTRPIATPSPNPGECTEIYSSLNYSFNVKSATK